MEINKKYINFILLLLFNFVFLNQTYSIEESNNTLSFNQYNSLIRRKTNKKFKNKLYDLFICYNEEDKYSKYEDVCLIDFAKVYGFLQNTLKIEDYENIENILNKFDEEIKNIIDEEKKNIIINFTNLKNLKDVNYENKTIIHNLLLKNNKEILNGIKIVIKKIFSLYQDTYSDSSQMRKFILMKTKNFFKNLEHTGKIKLNTITNLQQIKNNNDIKKQQLKKYEIIVTFLFKDNCNIDIDIKFGAKDVFPLFACYYLEKNVVFKYFHEINLNI